MSVWRRCGDGVMTVGTVWGALCADCGRCAGGAGRQAKAQLVACKIKFYNYCIIDKVYQLKIQHHYD